MKMSEIINHKGLRELYETGRSQRVRRNLQMRILRRLDALHAAAVPSELHAPGFGFHSLEGKPQRYALSVIGPWRITFEWKDDDAHAVGLEHRVDVEKRD